MSVQGVADPGSPDIGAKNPWLGLTAYTEDVSGLFFGRDRETGEVNRLVRRDILTILFGQSGLGKTSLLNAGLFPRLRDQDFLPIYIRIDYSPDSPDLTDQIKAAVSNHLETHQVDAPRPTAEESLWAYFHHKDTDFWSPRNRLLTPVLVFDQFEEIFTLGRSSDLNVNRTRAMIAELADLAENRTPDHLRRLFESDPDTARAYDFAKLNYKIIFSLREDYLPHLESLRAQIRSVMRNRLRLTRMNGLQAMQVVMEPGAGLIDEETSNRLVQFVAGVGGEAIPPEMPEDELADLEVEPALLSVVCRELNNKRVEQKQPRITLDLLAGSKSEIIKDFYERSVEDLPNAMRVLIEERLLTRSGYRDSVALEDVLEFEGASLAVIDTLVNRRLLRLEDRFGVQRVELTHDILTEVIQDSRDRRREEERLAVEKQQAEELRRKLWRARMAMGVFAVLLLLMIGAVAMTFMARNQAKTALDRAALTKAEYNALEGYRYLKNGKYDYALLYYLRSLEYRDNLGARIGAEEALVRFSPEVVRQPLDAKPDDLAFSDDGMFLAVLCQGKVRAWRVDNWKEVSASIRRPEKVTAMAVRPGYHLLAVAGDDGVIRLSDLAGSREYDHLDVGPGDVGLLGFSSDGARLLIAFADGSVQEWSVSDRTRTRVIKGPPLTFPAAFSPDGNLLASVRPDGATVLRALPPDGTAPTLQVDVKDVQHLSFSPDNRLLAGTSGNGRAWIWSLSSGNITSRFKSSVDKGTIQAARFSKSGRFVIRYERRLSILDTQTRPWSPLVEIHDNGRPIRRVCLSPGDKLAALVDDDAELSLRAAPRLSALLGGDHVSNLKTVIFSMDGRIGAVLDRDNQLRLWRTDQQEPIPGPKVSGGAVTGIALSPDGRYLATSYPGNRVTLWDRQSGALHQLPGPMTFGRKEQDPRGVDVCSALAFSRDGETLAAMSEFGEIFVWDVRHPRQRPQGEKTNIEGATILAVGAEGMLAAGYRSRGFRVWAPRSKSKGYVLKHDGRGHQGDMSALVFSPDSTLLACTAADGTVRLYQTNDWETKTVLRGHQGKVFSLAFSPDGGALITASQDRTVRFWSLVTGQEIAGFEAPAPVLNAVMVKKNPTTGVLVFACLNQRDYSREIDLSDVKIHGERLQSYLSAGIPWRLDTSDRPTRLPDLEIAANRLKAASSRKIPWFPRNGFGLTEYYKNEEERLSRERMTARLHAAISSNDLMLVRQLVDKSNRNSRFPDGRTPLTLAASLGHWKMAGFLCRVAHADPKIKNRQGLTAWDIALKNHDLAVGEVFIASTKYLNKRLAQAVNDGRFQETEYLLALGGLKIKSKRSRLSSTQKRYSDFDVNQKFKGGLTFIFPAAAKGHADIIRLLVSHGALINLRTDNGRTALMYAVTEGRLEAAEQLLDYGAEVEPADSNGRTALMLAAERGDLKITALLLQNGADPNARDKRGRTALTASVRLVHSPVADLLLENGADPWATDYQSRPPLLEDGANHPLAALLVEKQHYFKDHDFQGRTILMRALDFGETALAEYFLDQGVNPNERDLRGATALMTTAERGRPRAIELLVKRGADIDCRDSKGRTALALAVAGGHRESASLLLEQGADPEADDEDGVTPLMTAAGGGDSEMIRILLHRGASVNVKDLGGRTALLHAAAQGRTSVVKHLLSQNADLSAIDSSGWNAVMHAASHGHAQTVDYLCGRGADPNGFGRFGKSALMLAAQGGHTGAMEVLLSRGVSVHPRDRQGRSALMLAAAGGYDRAVGLLLKSGADMKAVDLQHWNALMHAVPMGRYRAAQLLLDKGLEVDQADREGRTALILAALEGQADLVRLLLDHGADSRAKDKSGRTPLAHARENGHRAVIELLGGGRKEAVRTTAPLSNPARHSGWMG